MNPKLTDDQGYALAAPNGEPAHLVPDEFAVGDSYSLQERVAAAEGWNDSTMDGYDRLQLDGTTASCYPPCRMRGLDPMVAVELIPDPEHGGFTARIPDIPAYGEGQTEDEAIADLKEAIRGYIETFGLEEAVARLSAPSALRHLDWDLAALARD